MAETNDGDASAPATEPAHADPRRGGYFERLFRGYGYLFRGWGFVGKHPGLLKFVWLPMLITVLVFAAVGFGFVHYYAELVDWVWRKPDSWLVIFWYLAYVFIFIVVVLLGYVAFFIVQGILTAPFNDVLSERVEQLASGREPAPFSWSLMFKSAGRAIFHEILRLSIWLMVMVPLLLISLFVPVLGTMVGAIGGFIVSARFFAYDHLDYCMGRRQWSFRRKRQVLKANRALTTGFGSSVATIVLIPIVGLLSIPVAAVGGTLLFCDLERAGALEQPDPAPVAAPAGPEAQ